MRFVWKGKYEDESQLEKGNLPKSAVKFREPDTFFKMMLASLWFIIPVIILVGIAIYIKAELGNLSKTPDSFNLLGFLLAFIGIVPHEIIHALLLPKDAEVHFWYSPKSISAFVHSTYPISKNRFIMISLAPNIILGLIPLIVWIFIPENDLSDVLLSFANLSLLMGLGDYLNVFNTMRQMPKDAMTQLSGFNSYWYRKEEI